MVTGLAFLSRLTQIAPPSTRFVFLGAGLRLGLPSPPATRRRSCLRLGVSTTSSSRGLSPPIDRPCRAYSRRRLRRRWPGVSAGLRPWGGPAVARRAAAAEPADQGHSHGAHRASAHPPSSTQQCPARSHRVNGAPCGRVACDLLRRPLTRPPLAWDRRLSRKDRQDRSLR